MDISICSPCIDDWHPWPSRICLRNWPFRESCCCTKEEISWSQVGPVYSSKFNIESNKYDLTIVPTFQRHLFGEFHRQLLGKELLNIWTYSFGHFPFITSIHIWEILSFQGKSWQSYRWIRIWTHCPNPWPFWRYTTTGWPDLSEKYKNLVTLFF